MALGMSTTHTRTALRSTSFASRPALVHSARRSLASRAYLGYPSPELKELVKKEFPDKGLANVEEARCLMDDGYKYLDVRSALECEEVGAQRGSVNVGFKVIVKKYNAETRKKDYIKSDNPDFVSQVKRKFPSLESKLLIACSDGTVSTIDALTLLDEAGYHDIVGLKGGYYAWTKTWDQKMARRRGDKFVQNAMAEEGDSMGIHSTGGGFENMGKIEAPFYQKY